MQKNPAEEKNRTKQKKKIPPQYLLILLVLGVVCMIGSNLFSQQLKTEEATAPVFKETKDTTDNESVETFGSTKESLKTLSDYKEKYESDLTDTLNNMAGVKNVQVVVTLASSEKKVYEKNTTTHTQKTEEEDKQGGKRSVDDQSVEEEVVIVQKDGEETPVVVQTETPEVKGVLVIAGGVENLTIKERVIEAVTRTLDVPRHKVSVQPRK